MERGTGLADKDNIWTKPYQDFWRIYFTEIANVGSFENEVLERMLNNSSQIFTSAMSFYTNLIHMWITVARTINKSHSQ